jgi:hypothetical protein
MGVVRLPQRQPRTYGPRTLVQQLPGIKIGAPAKPEIRKASGATVLNDSPRAGQSWEVQGIYFEFPEANKTWGGQIGSTGNSEFEFIIQLVIGGVICAKQIFVAISTVTDPEETAWPLVGNMESFQANTVYGGQTVEIRTEIKLINNVSGGFVETKVGKVILSYILHT